jgi:predicted acylesterase/phospholipase RssA
MQQARAYLLARRWHRDPARPTTALVMSGGGATGAFTAGFVSRMMEVFQCHHAPGGDQCPDARVDLVVGTSTGTLVGVLMDLFQVPGQEARAERMLIDNYTCSTEKDLYCKHDDWDWHLAENVRGLMHFNGIERKLTETLSPEVQTNASELVTLAVDYDSGDILAQSDQDPADRASGADRVQTVLASIVEPVLSDPVDYLMANGSRIKGTYIDAGVRSGLPLQQAVWRGAERTLVISTGNVDVSPAGHAASALPILLRTIDLSTSQNLVGEVQQAEFQAAARRLAEYNLCQWRMSAIDTIARKAFCERKAL